jgi:hypothetical protein
MKLIGYEIKKNFFRRSIFIVLLLATLVNIGKIYAVYQQNSLFGSEDGNEMNKAFWQLYNNQFKGIITNEKIEELLELYKPLYEVCVVTKTFSTAYNPNTFTGYVFGDFRMLELGFVQPMEYTYMYETYAQDIAIKAEENMKFFYLKGNNYEYKRNLKINNMFKGRNLNEFYHTEIFNQFYHYDFSSFLIILICLLGLVPMFVLEKETEMNFILLSSPYGRNKTVEAKIMASIIYTLLISIWFFIVDFLSFSYFFGLTGISQYVYAIEDFMLTPITLKMWQFILLSFSLKFMGFLSITYILLILSSLFKNVLLPYVIGLSYVFLLIFSNEFINERKLLQFLNPITLITNRKLFKIVEFINLLGTPIHKYFVVIICGLVLNISLILLIKMINNKDLTLRIRGF